MTTASWFRQNGQIPPHEPLLNLFGNRPSKHRIDHLRKLSDDGIPMFGEGRSPDAPGAESTGKEPRHLGTSAASTFEAAPLSIRRRHL
eukprot:2272053-Amphidinium_carterae.1